jgi:hypothetical protein
MTTTARNARRSSTPLIDRQTGLTARTYPAGETGSRCGSDERAVVPQACERPAAVSSWPFGPCQRVPVEDLDSGGSPAGPVYGVPVTEIDHAQSVLNSMWYGGAVFEMYSGAMSPPDLALPPNIVMETPFRSKSVASNLPDDPAPEQSYVYASVTLVPEATNASDDWLPLPWNASNTLGDGVTAVDAEGATIVRVA